MNRNTMDSVLSNGSYTSMRSISHDRLGTCAAETWLKRRNGIVPRTDAPQQNPHRKIVPPDGAGRGGRQATTRIARKAQAPRRKRRVVNGSGKSSGQVTAWAARVELAASKCANRPESGLAGAADRASYPQPADFETWHGDSSPARSAAQLAGEYECAAQPSPAP